MEPITRKFEQCPNCGSDQRFLEVLTNNLKDRGLARPNWSFYFDSRNGVVVDKAKEAAIPIGSKVPSFTIYTDICLDCGTIYAVYLGSGEVTKTIMPPKLSGPGDMPPGFNNPLAS